MKDTSDIINITAKGQHGIIGAHQLRQITNDDGIWRMENSGRIVREGPRVYRAGGAPRDWEMRAKAAVLSPRAPALISHMSAAYLYGLDGAPAPGFIDITVPRHRRPKRRSGVTVHESRDFDLAGARVINLIESTGLARTLLDCFAVLPDDIRRYQLFDDARRRKLVTWDELWECLLLHSGRGRPGIAPFRHILMDRNGEAPAGGTFARRAAFLLEGAGMPSPTFEHPAGVPGHDYFIDLAWPERKVGLECIGKIGHDFEAAYEDDPVRRNRIQLTGWTLLEVTWRRLRDEPAAVVAEVRQALGC